uniref:OTU domain-containing protein n=1 Tax=viral metagenome TaxID=1070528 RepID=A0A6C0JJ05_9ZZZZ
MWKSDGKPKENKKGWFGNIKTSEESKQVATKGSLISRVMNTGRNVVNASVEAKNKAKYLANLLLNTSNINKLHLKNQFYVEYMKMDTIRRVYSLERQPKINKDLIDANFENQTTDEFDKFFGKVFNKGGIDHYESSKDYLGKIVPFRWDITMYQGNLFGDNNFYLYGSTGITKQEKKEFNESVDEKGKSAFRGQLGKNVATTILTVGQVEVSKTAQAAQTEAREYASEPGVKESEEQEKEAQKFGAQQRSLMPNSLKKLTRLTGYKAKLPYGRLNNAVLIDRELYESIEKTLKDAIEKEITHEIRKGPTAKYEKAIQYCQRLRKLYNNYVCFSVEFDYLFKYLHFYRHQLNVMLWNGTLTPFFTIDDMIDEQNDMIFKNNEFRERYIDSMKLIFKVIALMSYVNPGISSKFKEVTNRVKEGEPIGSIQNELDKEVETQEEEIDKLTPVKTTTGGNSQHNQITAQDVPAPLQIIINESNQILQKGGGDSEILIRLRDYYDIPFEIDRLDPPLDGSENDLDSRIFKSLDDFDPRKNFNLKTAELKPLYSIYEAKYALVIAIEIMRRITVMKYPKSLKETTGNKKWPNKNNKDADQLANENFLHILNFEQTATSVLSSNKRYKIKFGKLNLKDEENGETSVFDKNAIDIFGNGKEIPIFNDTRSDWHDDFKKKLSFNDLVTTLTNFEKNYKKDLEKRLKDQEIKKQIADKIVQQKTLKIEEDKKRNQKTDEQNKTDQQEQQTKATSVQLAIASSEAVTQEYYLKSTWDDLINKYKGNDNEFFKFLKDLPISNGLPLELSSTTIPSKQAVAKTEKKKWSIFRGGNNSTRKIKRNQIGGNIFTETLAKAKKAFDQNNVFLKIIDSVLYTVQGNMIHRIMEGLGRMRDNTTMNSHTGLTMQNNLALCISKTMKYILRIPFLVCMAPMSEIIGHLTFGILASPHCFMVSHIFMSILLKSNILTQTFANDISKLVGNVMFKYKFVENIGKDPSKPSAPSAPSAPSDTIVQYIKRETVLSYVYETSAGIFYNLGMEILNIVIELKDAASFYNETKEKKGDAYDMVLTVSKNLNEKIKEIKYNSTKAIEEATTAVKEATTDGDKDKKDQAEQVLKNANSRKTTAEYINKKLGEFLNLKEMIDIIAAACPPLPDSSSPDSFPADVGAVAALFNTNDNIVEVLTLFLKEQLDSDDKRSATGETSLTETEKMIFSLKQKYLGKFCAINNNFMGLLSDVKVETNEEAEEQVYVFQFVTVDYNQTKTGLVGNKKIAKFGRRNRFTNTENIMKENKERKERNDNYTNEQQRQVGGGDESLEDYTEGQAGAIGAAGAAGVTAGVTTGAVVGTGAVTGAAISGSIVGAATSSIGGIAAASTAASLGSTAASTAAGVAAIATAGTVAALAAGLIPITIVIVAGQILTGSLNDAEKTGEYEKKEAYVTVKKGIAGDEMISEVIPYVYACPNWYDPDQRDIGSSITKLGSYQKGKHIHTEDTNIRKLQKLYRSMTPEQKKNPALGNLPEFQREYDYNGVYLGYIQSIQKKNFVCIPSEINSCTYEVMVPNILRSEYQPTDLVKVEVKSGKSIHVIVPYNLPAVTNIEDINPDHEYETLQCKATQNRFTKNETVETYAVNDLKSHVTTPEELLRKTLDEETAQTEQIKKEDEKKTIENAKQKERAVIKQKTFEEGKLGYRVNFELLDGYKSGPKVLLYANTEYVKENKQKSGELSITGISKGLGKYVGQVPDTNPIQYRFENAIIDSGKHTVFVEKESEILEEIFLVENVENLENSNASTEYFYVEDSKMHADSDKKRFFASKDNIKSIGKFTSYDKFSNEVKYENGTFKVDAKSFTNSTGPAIAGVKIFTKLTATSPASDGEEPALVSDGEEPAPASKEKKPAQVYEGVAPVPRKPGVTIITENSKKLGGNIQEINEKVGEIIREKKLTYTDHDNDQKVLKNSDDYINVDFSAKYQSLIRDFETIYTPGDGTCLIHSILYATSENYRKMDSANKSTVGKAFRKYLTELMPKEDKLLGMTQNELNLLKKEAAFLGHITIQYMCNKYKFNAFVFEFHQEGELPNTINIIMSGENKTQTNTLPYISIYCRNPIHFSVIKMQGEFMMTSEDATPMIKYIESINQSEALKLQCHFEIGALVNIKDKPGEEVFLIQSFEYQDYKCTTANLINIVTNESINVKIDNITPIE